MNLDCSLVHAQQPRSFGGSNMSYANRARPALDSMLMALAIACLAVLSVWPTTADAAVEGIEILAREPVAGARCSVRLVFTRKSADARHSPSIRQRRRTRQLQISRWPRVMRKDSSTSARTS